MKRFVFYVTTTGSSKYGGIYQYATVYQVKRDGLKFVGKTRKWNTASYMGASGEVNSYLLSEKYIPKSWSRDIDGIFTKYYRYNEKYEIKEI